MTSRDKRFEKIILGKGKEYPYDWIRIFLEHYGYTGRPTASSHITFRKEGYRHIGMVVHHDRVKRIYIKKMIQTLKKQNIL